MEDWLNTPAIIGALVAAVGSLIGIGMWIGSVNSDRSSFKEFTQEVRDNIKKIRENIERIFLSLPPSPIEFSSPIELTEYGEGLSEKLRARDWASRVAPTIQTNVSGKEPFRIDEYCKGHVSQISVETDPGVFKLAYENGISDENMRSVLAVVLRDELLSRMEET